MARLVDALPFKTQLLTQGLVELNYKKISAGDVKALLEPHLTTSRIERIASVVSGRTNSVAIVAEHLYDIGNISAVMRSSESYGFLPFHIIERSETKYKMSDRISKGTEKWLNIYKHQNTEKAFEKLRSEGYQIFATDLSATHSIEEIDFSKKTAVVFGNEKDGVSDKVKSHADGTFIIPMYGFAQSFNISVAAAICFSFIHRARCKALGQSGDLSADEKVNLTANYYMRTLDSAVQILTSHI